MRIEIKIRRQNRKKKGKFMKEKRFEGQAGPARTAHWAIGTKLRRAAFVFAALLPLGAAIAACTPEKEPVVEMNNETGLQVRSPDGAVPPKGLELVQFGMTTEQVDEILSTYSDRYRDPEPNEENETRETFSYSQNGELLRAYLYYRNRELFSVYYGYPYMAE